MEDFFKVVGAIVVVTMLVFLAGVVSGTILWIIYPHIHALFPNAAQNGIIAKDLGWWDAVCISWIFTIFFKTYNSNNKKE